MQKKDMDYAVGIDLGGSSIKCVVVTAAGEILERRQEDFDAEGHMEWGERIRSLVCKHEERQGNPPSAIGLSAPGLAAPDRRSIAYMPGRLEGLERLVWSDYLKTPFPVPVLNDGHAALLGEAWQGAARGYRDVVMITLGTGVGGAVLLNGRLWRGRTGKAGHVGHMSLDPSGKPDICRAPGSLERAIGNCTIAERSGGKFATTHDLITAHNAGDAEATQIWLNSVRALAAALCSLTNLLDPEAAIIGGGIARAGKALFEPLRQILSEMEWHTGPSMQVLPAELGSYAGAFGAVANAWGLFE